jgi:hypothetical protein
MHAYRCPCNKIKRETGKTVLQSDGELRYTSRRSGRGSARLGLSPLGLP